MRQCDICGKGSIVMNKRKKLRGKYNPTGKRRRYPNLQKAVINGQKVIACAQCIKTTNKTK